MSAGDVTATRSAGGPRGLLASGEAYKWVALSNTTLGVVLATVDASIVLIALPDIFRGIGLDPLLPSNSFYLLWMILGYLVVTSVLVVSLGRLGDMFGRVRVYNIGFVIYTVASLLLTVTWLTGSSGALYLVVMRLVQGVGGACLMASSAAILTDAFPEHQRGLALGINNVAGVAGQFVGLVLGGLLAPVSWRLVFLISVPIGLAGTIWSLVALRDSGVRVTARIDWLGNATFAVGLVLLMVGITYGIQPSGDSSMGWGSTSVIAEIVGGLAILGLFGLIEWRRADPMFPLQLFRIRAYTAGVLASFLSALARGGLMFMLILWLQGIWLPEHGHSFAETPLWAGIYMLPLTAGFLIAGPVSGILSDRFGPRPFATGGMVGAALTFVGLDLFPIDFDFTVFALLIFVNGLSMGAFASPNRAGVMNSIPAAHRGSGAGMNQTFQNSAQVLSIGIFFTLMIVGLSATLPGALFGGLTEHGVAASTATDVAHLPAVSIIFAAFLGYNPIEHVLDPSTLQHLSTANASTLTGREYFPHLITEPFTAGLHQAFTFAFVVCLIAAAASWSRGPRRTAAVRRPTGAVLAASAVPLVLEPPGEVVGATAERP